MDIKLDNIVVGNVYSNMQLSKKDLKLSTSEILFKIKEGEFKVTLGTKEILLKSYRKHWLDQDFLYLEGISFEIL